MKKLMLILVSVLVLTSCGDSYKAKGLAKYFLNENLKDADMSGYTAGKFDKTARVTPERIEQIRAELAKQKEFNSNINYAPGNIPDTLFYLRVKFNLTDNQGNEKKCSGTCYFDKELTRVIGFTEN